MNKKEKSFLGNVRSILSGFPYSGQQHISKLLNECTEQSILLALENLKIVIKQGVDESSEIEEDYKKLLSQVMAMRELLKGE